MPSVATAAPRALLLGASSQEFPKQYEEGALLPLRKRRSEEAEEPAQTTHTRSG